ncbi:4-hydroxy-tetrahydrodipicolinate reductase [Winogradskyella alexanderae]|uniref:4-hydroxy-tetrahydrodipicolinate reductase n=1 Tax=Winogradskyella alexanderae TaxID=2877123 RepID=A0ABS7XTN4_9FLAO|nr:4-hydroxy-tetrahydrodipicolinate reductase [Winogradskyella alexanderae]MCA0132262.1 4-hydroxy-tetrahydrodipicolinate reductase [Winogradskyella alexanderae]
MNIALLGYGKMGKSIEEIALKRNHIICLKVSEPDDEFNFSECDVAIDFSVPSAAETNIKKALDANIPVISGTTGWLDNYSSIVNYCNVKNGTFLYASNFSLGVNIFFEINKQLSKLMSGHKDYSVSIEEIHHTQKLDAPSGTAISLAEQIIENTDYDGWVLQNATKDKITIEAIRIEGVPGTHEISYDSEIDSIQIKHTAHSRKGFALGAVIAAEWIKDKKGIFTMKDVLNIG